VVDHLVDPPSSGGPFGFWNGRFAAFSIGGARVAVGRASTAIIGLHCSASKLIVDVDMRVADIKVVAETVFAFGAMRVVSWSLVAG
jgi:hypothetical protein